MTSESSFLRLGPRTPCSPVVFSVPHAGRRYPVEFAALARLPASRLLGLEDRYADLLVPEEATALVALTARAWIDLNRSEREFDPKLVIGGHRLSPMLSAKARGGLGVVPRRLAREGEIWRGPMSASHLIERIERHHRPYHHALNEALDAALARFGVAVLIDLHSMPSLVQDDAPGFVIGDLFGRSAHARFAQAAREVLEEGGTPVALNAPYAGGHILERHARPHRAVHGLQIEVDRSLYLDAALDQAAEGAAKIRCKIAILAHALAAEALAEPFAIAAE